MEALWMKPKFKKLNSASAKTIKLGKTVKQQIREKKNKILDNS